MKKIILKLIIDGIFNKSMEMVIHQKKHQKNILYISKCKQKEAYFVDFHTT